MRNKDYENKKNVVVKHTDSSMPKERYQADTVQFSKHVITYDYKYLLTMVDHFTKYVWIVSLKDKTSLKVLKTFRNESQLIILQWYCKLIMEQSLRIK